MNVEKVFVLGAGIMGNGIAQVCAQCGISVVMCDISQELLDKAVKNMTWSVSKFIEKGKIKESQDEVLGRIETTMDFDAAGEVDLIIEAVFEDIKVKHDILKKIDSIVKDDTIIASNTSAIPITEIASATSRPENFIGLHFFNPVPMMLAVEVIKGYSSNEEAFQYGADFVRLIGKEPIMVRRDLAGFLLNRINILSTIA